MPHSLFLGSALATQDRIDYHKQKGDDDSSLKSTDSLDQTHTEPRRQTSIITRIARSCKEGVLAAFRKPEANLYARAATRHSEHNNNPFAFVRAHIYHGTFDIVSSLLGFAVMINSL